MIRLPKQLTTRLSLAILLAIAIGSIVFGMLFYAAYDRLEHEMLNALISYVSYQDSSATEESSVRPDYEHVQVYDGSENSFPEVLSTYQHGFYHNIAIDSRNYHLAVTGYGSQRKFVLFDITDIERAEMKIGYLIGMGALLIVLAVGWLIFWLSKNVLSPVKTFANEVATIEPGVPNIRLSPKYQEVEVGAIANSFDRFMQRLDEFIEREQFFTSAASHELRTPLSIIMTSTELLQSKMDVADPAQPYLKRIHRSAQEMSNIITALLFLSRERVEQDHAEICEQVRLVDVVNYAVQDFHDAGLTMSSCMSIETHDDSAVNALFSHLYIVIRNVLSNAIKYGKQQPILIRIQAGSVVVSDHGEGVDEQEYENLYRRGFKGQHSQGQGLGLFIVKSFCDYYGWTIDIRSNMEQGTTVTIQF